MRKQLLLLMMVIISSYAFSQKTFPVNGVTDSRVQGYAFTNTTIIQLANHHLKMQR